MAVQSNNLMLLDVTGIPRTIDAANDSLSIGVDTTIGGDLTVTGDFISRSQVDVILQDAFLDLAFPSTDPGTTAGSGGFTVMMNRNSGFTAGVITTFTAGAGADAPTFTYTQNGGNNASLLAANDIVAISGAATAGNDGYFIVDSVDQAAFPQVVTIKGVSGNAVSASVPFAQNQFSADTGDTAAGYKVDVAAVALADGTNAFKDSGGQAWPKGTFVTAYIANATSALFEANAAWDALAAVSLQEAYVTGNTITTSGAEGAVIIAGDQLLSVTSSAGAQISAGGLNITGGPLDVDTSVDVDLTGSFHVDGNQAVNFGGTTTQVASFTVDTVGAFNVLADSASTIRVDGADLNLSTNTSGNFDVTSAGNVAITAADGSTLSVDHAGGSSFQINATGQVDIAGESGAAMNIGTTQGNLSLSTSTSGNFDVTSAGNVAITAADGSTLSVDHAGGSSFAINATGQVDITSEANASMNLLTQGNGAFDVTSAGNVAISAADGSTLSVDHLGGSAFTIGQAGAIGINAESGSAVSVGATSANIGLSTTTSGNIGLNSAGQLNLEGDDNSKLEMVANAAGATKTLTILADNSNNANASNGELFLKAKTLIQIGDFGNYATSSIKMDHFTEFGYSAGYDADAGEALAIGDLVMAKYDGVNNETRFYKAANNAASDNERIVYGIAATAANAAGDPFSMQSVVGTKVRTALSGLATADVGKPVYLGTAGALTLTAPQASGTTVFKVGYIVGHNTGPGSTAEVHFAPQFIAKRP